MSVKVLSRSLLVALFAALCSESSSAQYASRDSRRIVAVLREPSFSMRPNTNLLKVGYDKQAAFHVAVPIDYPADFHPIPSETRPQDLDRLLLVGRDTAGNGVMAWLQILGDQPTQWSVLDVLTQPGSDFIGVTYANEAQKLYMLELSSQSIFWAPFSLSSPTLPTAWTFLAHSSQFGGVADLPFRGLDIQDEGDDPRLNVYYVNRDLRETPVVVDTPIGPAFDMIPGDDQRVSIATRELLYGASSVPLVGPPSSHADLLRMDDPGGVSIVGSVQLDASGSGSVSVSTSPLVFGAVYGARNQLHPAPSAPFVTPEKRWGSAQGLADGNEIRPLRWIGLTAFVGSDFFRLPCYIEVVNPPPSLPHSYLAILLVGDESSPILDVGGISVLSTSIAFSTNIEIYSQEKPGFGLVRLPIPHDPLLGGAEVRYQWLVDDSTGLRVSDIAGIRVRQQMWIPPGNEGVLQDASTLASAAGQAERGSAFRSWLQSCGSLQLSRESWRDVLGRIRR